MKYVAKGDGRSGIAWGLAGMGEYNYWI